MIATPIAMEIAAVFARPCPVRQADRVCTADKSTAAKASARTSDESSAPSASGRERKMNADTCDGNRNRNAAAGIARNSVHLTAKQIFLSAADLSPLAYRMSVDAPPEYRPYSAVAFSAYLLTRRTMRMLSSILERGSTPAASATGRVARRSDAAFSLPRSGYSGRRV